MLQEKNSIIQGLNVRYYQNEKFSIIQPVIFLHGWGSRAMIFGKIFEKCSNILAVDLPGFGGSEAPRSAWSLSDYAFFINEFFEKMGIENPIIAGHSFGGSIGIKYCSKFSNVKKLILMGSAGIREKTAKKYLFFMFSKILVILWRLPIIRASKESIRKYFYKLIDSEDYLNAGMLADTYKKIINEDLKEDLKKIHTPAVLIWGENDLDTPIQNAKLMHSLLKNSQLYIIPNAGHYVFLDNEAEFEHIFLANMK
ncbi:MAG: alpha/beta hydrolase [Parcubacteria group bacterium]